MSEPDNAAPEQAPTDAPVSSSTSPLEGNSTPAAEALVLADLLVEDVSIDGMCGIY